MKSWARRPETRRMTRPNIAKPRFEYSPWLCGAHANVAPLLTSSSSASSEMSRCRSAHASSVASPPAIDSR